MVFVSQQYDQYQQSVNKIAQYQDQAQSENLIAQYPGLGIVNSTTSWGSGCDGSGVNKYNCYNMTLSNLGGVSVQIARVYINSTGTAGSGCSYSPSSPNPQPCILNPSIGIAPYTFEQANQLLNPGEVDHGVLLALPLGVALPNPSPYPFPENTILIATSRGNVFSFQWPYQIQIGGQSGSAFSTGIIKVAYQPTSSTSSSTSCTSASSSCNSANEPGLGGTGTVAHGYCHEEPLVSYPAPYNDAEKLTGITGSAIAVTGSTLYFVDPWVTQALVESVINDNNTQLYIYVNVKNIGATKYTPTSGSLDLTWYSATHLDGTLIGVYYNGQFYPTLVNGATNPGLPTIPTNGYYYAIYQIKQANLSSDAFTGTDMSSVMFWGDASITDWVSESTSYYSATILLSGFWVRAGC